MIYTAKVMAGTLAAVLADPDVLDAATAEFQAKLDRLPYECPIPEGTLAPPLRYSAAAD
jgi:aminobenzoyl-glutamate utilization protein B